MAKTYDVTFHTLDGRGLIKRDIESVLPDARVFEDACEKIEADNLFVRMNEKTLVRIKRNTIVSIDTTIVDSKETKRTRRLDEFTVAMSQLSQMGI